MGTVLSEQEVLDLVRGAAKFNQFDFTGHGDGRSNQRMATVRDVARAMMTATRAVWDQKEDTWLLSGGVDRDGEGLRVAVAIDGRMPRIVTVMSL